MEHIQGTMSNMLLDFMTLFHTFQLKDKPDI